MVETVVAAMMIVVLFYSTRYEENQCLNLYTRHKKWQILQFYLTISSSRTIETMKMILLNLRWLFGANRPSPFEF